MGFLKMNKFEFVNKFPKQTKSELVDKNRSNCGWLKRPEDSDLFSMAIYRLSNHGCHSKRVTRSKQEKQKRKKTMSTNKVKQNDIYIRSELLHLKKETISRILMSKVERSSLTRAE
jgi:hypothetical protein